jgi:hypothetical protein
MAKTTAAATASVNTKSWARRLPRRRRDDQAATVCYHVRSAWSVEGGRLCRLIPSGCTASKDPLPISRPTADRSA